MPKLTKKEKIYLLKLIESGVLEDRYNAGDYVELTFDDDTVINYESKLVGE